MSRIPRLVIAAVNSGAGKTTVTVALLKALCDRHLHAASFKCGPDYIDPMFHREALGVPSYNLDLFFSSPETVRALVNRHTSGVDIAVIEGAMGFYDGVSGGESGSSYDIARVTETPVILVVPAKGASLSIAAVVQGFCNFRSDSNVRGVILNGCSEAQYESIRMAIERETGVRVFGFLPNIPAAAISSRHLGLMTAGEVSDLKAKIECLGEAASEHLDIDGIIQLAKSAGELCSGMPDISAVTTEKPVIAVAVDKAFSFYYSDNLELLRKLGAEICTFSPMSDAKLPDNTAGLYIGGGYPEVYAKTLSENTAMRNAIHSAIEGGMPTVAECGGFLYLHRMLEAEDGTDYQMADVFPEKAFRTKKLSRFGYITLKAHGDSLLFKAGETVPAHEFHYWDSENAGDALSAVKPDGRAWDCGVITDTLYAGFPHLYFYSAPEMAKRFVKAAQRYHTDNF